MRDERLRTPEAVTGREALREVGAKALEEVAGEGEKKVEKGEGRHEWEKKGNLTEELERLSAKFGVRRRGREEKVATVATAVPVESVLGNGERNVVKQEGSEATEEEFDWEGLEEKIEAQADKILRDDEWRKEFARAQKEAERATRTANETWRAAEKLKKHERAQKMVKKIVRRGLAVAGLALGLLATSMSVQDTRAEDKMAGRSARIETEAKGGSMFDELEDVEMETEEEVASETTGGSMFDGLADIEAENEGEPGGRLVNMIPATQAEEDAETDAKTDEEWKSALATVENADISDYDIQPGEPTYWESWEDFVNRTNELDADAPFEITTSETAQYIANPEDKGKDPTDVNRETAPKLINRTYDGRIYKG